MPATGRIDVHAHLLPDVDDGCRTVAQSIECARRLVDAGYTHLVCTPHVWPGQLRNTAASIGPAVEVLQRSLDERAVPLKLLPGGELNLTQATQALAPSELVSYAMAGRYCLFDIWVDVLPDYFEPGVRRLQELGCTVILAHPERMPAFQLDPSLLKTFRRLNLLLQGNLECLGDDPHTPCGRLARRLLSDGEYFLLATDLHNPQTLEKRLRGLETAREIVGESGVDRLTRENPRTVVFD